jgi:hypothetical protein
VTGVWYPAGAGIFLANTSRPILGPTQPPFRRLPGAPSAGGKRLGREADHSPPYSAEVMNVWSYTSIPPYNWIAWYLVKHKENFYLYRTLPYRYDRRTKLWDCVSESRGMQIASYLQARSPCCYSSLITRRKCLHNANLYAALQSNSGTRRLFLMDISFAVKPPGPIFGNMISRLGIRGASPSTRNFR